MGSAPFIPAPPDEELLTMAENGKKGEFSEGKLAGCGYFLPNVLELFL
jgi:hypothetical protein